MPFAYELNLATRIRGVIYMATVGRIEEFREEKEECTQYAERLKHFFALLTMTRSVPCFLQ